jgi:hypothetical protein
MTHTVLLELSEELAQSVQSVAQHTHRRLEDLLVDWIDQVAADLPIEYLPDEEVLAIAEKQLDAQTQQELSSLLEANREGALDSEAQVHLDELMQLYRRGLVRKAQALKIAIDRGLRPPLICGA